jgi:hypothetical protein
MCNRSRLGWSGVVVALAVASTATAQSRKPATADPLGVQKLFPTAKLGREWFAAWERPRSIDRSARDPADPQFRNSDGVLTIADGVARAPAGQTRLFIDTPQQGAGRYTMPQWRNVEMTVYFKRGEATRDVSSQAVSLNARSGERHSNEAPCDGTSYHAMLRLDGRCGFKKEVWHTGGYTDLKPEPTPRPWETVPVGAWIGMKFVCRNCDDDKHVLLQMYLDPLERNEWRLVAETTDRGGWEGKEAGCDRPKDYIIAEARPSVYFRTDYVPVELKRFSVREIQPLK